MYPIIFLVLCALSSGGVTRNGGAPMVRIDWFVNGCSGAPWAGLIVNTADSQIVAGDTGVVLQRAETK